ncbi:MAG: hypothetical protein ABL994_26165, partial [Verrucomicrobiales bacterium]
ILASVLLPARLSLAEETKTRQLRRYGETIGLAVENEAVASAGDEMAAWQTPPGAEPTAESGGETDFPVAGGEAPALETETPLAVVA